MRFYLRSADRRPDPAPLQSNDRRTVFVGIAIWSALLIAAVIMRGELAATGRGWWIWTPVTGIALGLFGLNYLRRH